MALLKFIATVLLIYFIIKFIFRFVFPLLLSLFISRSTSSNGDYNSRKNKPEGNVTIKGSKSEKHFSDKIGEYVDYEDVKD